MNQDSSFPPMLPPSTELGALLFAILPCLQETYRPLASFAYHMTELTRLKTIPSVPSLTGLSGIEALITDKDSMLRSLSFYGRMFRMPLLSTIATLLQGFQFYQTYKDILPGLFSGMNCAGGDSTSAFGNMAGLFSGLGGLGGFGNSNNSEGSSPDIFSMLGGLSPDLISSLLSGLSGGFSSGGTNPASSATETSDRVSQTKGSPDDNFAEVTVSPDNTPSETTSGVADSLPDYPPQTSPLPDDIPTVTGSAETSEPEVQTDSAPPTDDLYNSLYAFLTPEQQKIYEQLMHTD